MEGYYVALIGIVIFAIIIYALIIITERNEKKKAKKSH
ncbi:hypothetical protein A45J_0171 [hot springs metagenome]|uniref:Uncharacterized protein n=1 Tax=hot springs metagenome TaxID=433727 RepID=A0A5J4KWW3_9ZZZZ